MGAGDVELVGRRVGGADETHLGLVESIDKRRKTVRLVALLAAHPGDSIEHQRMEILGQREIVAGAEGLLAQLGEGKVRDPARGLGHLQRMAADFARDRLAARGIGQVEEGAIEGGAGLGPQRGMADRPAGDPRQAVVDAAVEVQEAEAVAVRPDLASKSSTESMTAACVPSGSARIWEAVQVASSKNVVTRGFIFGPAPSSGPEP